MRRRFLYRPLRDQHGTGPNPFYNKTVPQGVAGAAPPLTIEVRAVGGAVVYADNMEIPGDQFVTVMRSPHITLALQAGDLEQRPAAVTSPEEDKSVATPAYDEPAADPAPPPPPPSPSPPTGGIERWVYERLRRDRDTNARAIWESRPDGVRVSLKRIQNLVSECRKLPELSRKVPGKTSKSSR